MPLVAELTSNGKVIDIDDFNMVSFDIKKLSKIAPDTNTPETIYDREVTGALADIENIRDYINFKPLQIRAQKGLANYSFSTKNEDINIVFDARILTRDRYGRIIVDKIADPITVVVRSLRIAVKSKIQVSDLPFSVGSVLNAGNPHGILFNLSKINKNQITLSDNSPYTLRIYDDVANILVKDAINVSTNEYLFQDTGILNKS